MKRPIVITVICVFGYLSVLFTFPQVFSPGIKKLGVLMPAIYGIITAAQFMSYVGLWYYKQWGVQLYLIAFFSKILFFLLNEQAGVTLYISMIIAAVFTVLMLRHYPKMSPNL
jgi:hypothetical protein